ncbi:hypothetical protein MUK42_28485 [Musa troglodytarum]|nr:hypothetical protein MUK42_28485 [Musa troglodytarum]URD90002.1 hypothetical protein MUK42_28485 [Musa troglodytarum]URD90003.1 hypothetical protein MUK42_28485 [Musa troglodytarum]URD90004.1 hypothetical protein MUK42_28485 [Musa troglodytarum]URD90005.1 hypothetical protein MUK42_28485 [Musa troglodytarum]
MGMRGNPEGRLASKVALLCCAFLFIFSVLSLTAGNSSGRDRSEITSWRTMFDPQVSSSLKPSRCQVEDK